MRESENRYCFDQTKNFQTYIYKRLKLCNCTDGFESNESLEFVLRIHSKYVYYRLSSNHVYCEYWLSFLRVVFNRNPMKHTHFNSLDTRKHLNQKIFDDRKWFGTFFVLLLGLLITDIVDKLLSSDDLSKRCKQNEK